MQRTDVFRRKEVFVVSTYRNILFNIHGSKPESIYLNTKSIQQHDSTTIIQNRTFSLFKKKMYKKNVQKKLYIVKSLNLYLIETYNNNMNTTQIRKQNLTLFNKKEEEKVLLVPLVGCWVLIAQVHFAVIQVYDFLFVLNYIVLIYTSVCLRNVRLPFFLGESFSCLYRFRFAFKYQATLSHWPSSPSFCVCVILF